MLTFKVWSNCDELESIESTITSGMGSESDL